MTAWNFLSVAYIPILYPLTHLRCSERNAVLRDEAEAGISIHLSVQYWGSWRYNLLEEYLQSINAHGSDIRQSHSKFSRR
jgi:hypothetical protein